MIVGVVIPDRGDRPQLTAHCLWMIQRQTKQPDYIEHVNYPPDGRAYDLTQRVRRGYDKLKSKGCECVLIMENDDWYSPFYIAHMVHGWNKLGRPQLFGFNETTYYHLGSRMYRTLVHENRASLMSTLISCEIDSIKWPKDTDIFLDLFLWAYMDGVAVKPSTFYNVGIKHGIGLCGGTGHTTLHYDQKDPELENLKLFVDPISFGFYSTISEECRLASSN